MTVLAVGAYALDLYMFGDRIPGRGESVTAFDLASAGGGKAANVAVAAARLGANSRLVAVLGDDPEGDAALAVLERDGVDVEACTQVRARTARSFILVDAMGDQYVMTWPGAASQLTAEAATTQAARLLAGSVLVLQGEVPVAVSAAAAAAAHDAVTVLLNPSPVEEFLQGAGVDLLRRADILVANAMEYEYLAARTEILPPAVVVTRGAQGANVLVGDRRTAIAAPVVDAVDTTGAGDGFTGALAAALQAGRSLHDGVELGCRAAAMSVTRRFCAPSYATARELGIAPLGGGSGTTPRG